MIKFDRKRYQDEFDSITRIYKEIIEDFYDVGIDGDIAVKAILDGKIRHISIKGDIF